MLKLKKMKTKYIQVNFFKNALNEKKISIWFSSGKALCGALLYKYSPGWCLWFYLFTCKTRSL